MAQTYNFAPITEENGPLAKYEIGETVHKTVRIMSCIYTGNQGFGVYEVDENDRRFTIIGSFPYQLSMNAAGHHYGAPNSAWVGYPGV